MSPKDKPFFLKGTDNIGILLIHGWTSPPDELFPLAKYLNALGYSVSAPLLRGHGTRPEDLAGIKWKDWLEDSRKALKELKKHSDKIFVGGISMGGSLALLLSEDDSVAGVITMGTAVKYRFQALGKMGLHILGLGKTYRKKYYPPWIRKKMKSRRVYLYYPIESAKEVVRLAEKTKRFLPRVKRPLLIMQSTADHMVSKRSPRIIFNGVKSKIKEILWIDNAYHVFVDDRKTWEKIANFIRRITK